MKQVVMGTDIRLQFTLDDLSEFDRTSIKQLRCYVIRKEDIQYINLDNYGYPQYYSPTDYDLMYTSCCRYNWLPYNQYVYNCGMFGPIDDYRYFPAYNGFGVNSKQFKIVPDKYLASSRVINDTNTIEMYFPAQDQKDFGKYIVLIVVTVYQPGWGSNNLRTFTINKGVQFEIVDGNDTQQGNTNNQQSKPSNIEITDEDYNSEPVTEGNYTFANKAIQKMFNMNVSNKLHKVINMHELYMDHHNYVEGIALVWDQQTAKLFGVFQDSPQIYSGIGNNGNSLDATTINANITLNQVTIDNVTSDYTIWHVHL